MSDEGGAVGGCVCVWGGGGVGGIVIKHKLWKSEETGHVYVQP